MVQFTPFPLVDSQLNHVDLMLGFNSAHWFNWTMHHPWAYRISTYVYAFLQHELLWVPVILALLEQKRSLDIFFTCCLLTSAIGFTIYYFFPTTEPANVVHGATFLHEQYLVVQQFKQMHAHKAVTDAIGGVVGLPSFHVIWSILLVYAARNKKWLFYPLLVMNSLIILSTLTLAWHFLADVLAGFVVAGLSIWIAQSLCRVKEDKTKSSVIWRQVPVLGRVLKSLRPLQSWLKA